MKKKNDGFTLIELLVAITILAVLSIVVLVGLKPAQRMADSRDARRAQDVNELLTGIHECAIDKKDSATLSTCIGPTVIDQTYEIVNTGVTTGCTATCTSAASGASCLPLDVKLTDYFTTLPKDPITQATGHTGYSITRKTNGMVILEACAAENSPIVVSR